MASGKFSIGTKTEELPWQVKNDAAGTKLRKASGAVSLVLPKEFTKNLGSLFGKKGIGRALFISYKFKF